MSKCPNCGIQGGGAGGCGSCGFGKVPGVGNGLMGAARHNPNSSSSWTNSSSSSSSGGKRDDGCFPDDSMVPTPFGLRRLDSVRPGDSVMSVSSSGKLTVARVVRVQSHPPLPVMRVSSSTAALSFSATGLHPVQTQRGWVRVKDLRQGDILAHLEPSGRLVEHTVLRVDHVATPVHVRNLVVDGDHTWAPHGCVAHSFVHFRRLRCLVSALLGRRVVPASPEIVPT